MPAAAKRRILAIVSVALLGTVVLSGVAGGAWSGKRDRVPPTPPANPHVTWATTSAVFVEWDPSQDNVGVAGYYVYGDTGGRAKVSGPGYTVGSLGCGESATIWIAAFDRAGNRSSRVESIVATAACPDVQPPTSPSGFRQAATTQNAVVLGWDRSTDNVGVVGYGVYRNLARIASAAEPTVTLSGLGCGSMYTYDVDAVDAAGNRSSFGTAFVQTASCSDGQPPSSPTGLAATARTETSIAVSWSPSTDNLGVAGYHVLVNGSLVSTGTQTSSAISSLSCGTTYTIGVDAFDVAGNQSPASSIPASTEVCPQPPPPPPGDTTPPSTPTGLAASNVLQTGLNLSWNAASDNVGITGYDVYRNGTKIASVAATSLGQSSLACGTSYVFSVEALDAAGNRSQRAQLTVSTSACSSPPPPPADTTPPSQPANLGISSSTRTSIALTWSASTDNVGVVGYRTYVNGAPGATSTQPGATVANLSCGTAYTFEVDAYDAAANRSSKASLVGSTAPCLDTQPPSAPANLVATSRTSTSIALSWSASTDNVGVTGYGLYRGGAQVGTSSSTTGIFSGLTCNTNYTLGVDSTDAAANRSLQTVVMVSTTACPDTTPPSTPTGLAGSNVSQTGLTLTWSASTDNVGVTGYDVYRNGTKMATVTSTSSSQTGLACGTSYAFAAAALDAAGNSSPQAQVNATTAACSTPPPTTTVTMGETGVQSVDDSGNGNLLVSQKAALTQSATIRSISFYVTTASGKLRLGVYDATGPNGGPGRKIAETGEVTPASGWNTGSVVSPVTLAAGNYWLAYFPSSYGLGFRSGNGGEARFYNLTYGAMPGTFSTSPTSLQLHWSLYATLDGQGSSTPPLPACSDANDNDADGKIDFPADPGCVSVSDTDETDAPAPPPGNAPPPIAGQGYSKVWGDEFSTLDPPSWGGIWWNPTAPANSIYVQNGILNLVSRRSQGYPDITLSTESSTSSGRWKQGYFEARMKWTKGPGAWPGFWLMGYAHSQGIDCPPLISELDVFEGQGTEPGTFYGTLHRNTNSGCGVPDETNDGWHNVADMTTAFHTYSALWTLTEIKWYLDDVLVGTAPVYDSTNQEMFLLLQMWIGGWTSDPTSATPDELRTEVDWVHVWQK